MSYLVVKALHVAALVVWTAGVFTVPLVLHRLVRLSPVPVDAIEALRTAFHRTATPAFVLTWALGLWLTVEGGFLRQGWFGAKIALVVGVSVLHGMLSGLLRRTAEGTPASVHAVPAWLGPATGAVLAALVVISLLVLVKPF